MQFSTLTLLIVALFNFPVSFAQSDGPAVDPNYVCPQATLDQITTCLGTVYSDEVSQPGGACSSANTESNWQCICNLQYGLTQNGCYAPCPGSTSAEDQQYFDQNCKGQHFGVQPSSYSGSPLTTSGASGSTGTGPASTSSIPSTLSMATSSNSAPSSSATSSAPQSSSTSATSSGAPAGNNNAGSSVLESKAAFTLTFALVSSAAMGAILL